MQENIIIEPQSRKERKVLNIDISLRPLRLCGLSLYLKNIVLLWVLLSIVQTAQADMISVAVASNALDAIKLIGKGFQKQSGHRLHISSGSTGKLYAQIYNGAPFDVFLAANVREPKRLEEQDLILKGSRFTYALGRLSLCRQDMIKARTVEGVLKDAGLKRLSIANPKTAPYGVAAKQVLESLGLWASLKPRLIRGENIGQAYQYYASGNTQAAFLASSQVKSKPPLGHCIDVEQKYYQPIRQQAVVLKRAKDSVAVKLFIDFLKGRHVKRLLTTRFGYGVE